VNRTAVTAEIAAVAGFQLALAALLRHATERATVLEAQEAVPARLPEQRSGS
jgi:hypothetical protein